MSERVFERANDHRGAFFVAGCAATAHWCLVELTRADTVRGLMHQ